MVAHSFTKRERRAYLSGVIELAGIRICLVLIVGLGTVALTSFSALAGTQDAPDTVYWLARTAMIFTILSSFAMSVCLVMYSFLVRSNITIIGLKREQIALALIPDDIAYAKIRAFSYVLMLFLSVAILAGSAALFSNVFGMSMSLKVLSKKSICSSAKHTLNIHPGYTLSERVIAMDCDLSDVLLKRGGE